MTCGSKVCGGSRDVSRVSPLGRLPQTPMGIVVVTPSDSPLIAVGTTSELQQIPVMYTSCTSCFEVESFLWNSHGEYRLSNSVSAEMFGISQMSLLKAPKLSIIQVSFHFEY